MYIVDQLSRDAKEARRLRLSYGKYMGLKYEAAMKAKETAQPKKPKPGERRCKVCEKEIPLTVSSSRYCSPECAHKAQTDMRKEAERRRKLLAQGIEVPPEPDILCGTCGKVVKNRRRKYCCPECAETAKRLQTVAGKMRAKLKSGKK